MATRGATVEELLHQFRFNGSVVVLVSRVDSVGLAAIE